MTSKGKGTIKDQTDRSLSPLDVTRDYKGGGHSLWCHVGEENSLR